MRRMRGVGAQAKASGVLARQVNALVRVAENQATPRQLREFVGSLGTPLASELVTHAAYESRAMAVAVRAGAPLPIVRKVRK